MPVPNGLMPVIPLLHTTQIASSRTYKKNKMKNKMKKQCFKLHYMKTCKNPKKD